MSTVWVAFIDIGQDVLEPIHAFDNADAATRYREWAETRSQETCYIAPLTIESTWDVEVVAA